MELVGVGLSKMWYGMKRFVRETVRRGWKALAVHMDGSKGDAAPMVGCPIDG